MSADGAVHAQTSVLRLAERLDLRVLVPALLLTATGLVSLGSAEPDMVGTQFSGVVVGIIAALVLVLLPYRTVLAVAWPLWALSVVLLVAVLLPHVGVKLNGAQRWLRIGGAQIQPSEFAKAAHVLLLARYIRFRQDHKTFKGLFIPFALTLIPMLLILREPDLGSALLFVPPLFAMLWAAGARTRHLLLVVAFGVASLPLVYSFGLAKYQRARIDGFIAAVRPGAEKVQKELDPVERQNQRDRAHQADRAELAIAAGGLTGSGWGEGRMNIGEKVPYRETDFIFTVHAEEWGFVGSAGLVLLFGVFLFAVTSVAQECREPAARLMCVGVLASLGCQICVNLWMTMRLAPATGAPLPFLSCGRSAMLSAWLLTGLVLHAKAREPHVFTTSDFD